MNDFDRVLTWYRTVMTTPQTDNGSYAIWREIHRVGQHMLPELLSVVTAAQDYANDPRRRSSACTICDRPSEEHRRTRDD